MQPPIHPGMLPRGPTVPNPSFPSAPGVRPEFPLGVPTVSQPTPFHASGGKPVASYDRTFVRDLYSISTPEVINAPATARSRPHPPHMTLNHILNAFVGTHVSAHEIPPSPMSPYHEIIQIDLWKQIPVPVVRVPQARILSQGNLRKKTAGVFVVRRIQPYFVRLVQQTQRRIRNPRRIPSGTTGPPGRPTVGRPADGVSGTDVGANATEEGLNVGIDVIASGMNLGARGLHPTDPTVTILGMGENVISCSPSFAHNTLAVLGQYRMGFRVEIRFSRVISDWNGDVLIRMGEIFIKNRRRGPAVLEIGVKWEFRSAVGMTLPAPPVQGTGNYREEFEKYRTIRARIAEIREREVKLKSTILRRIFGEGRRRLQERLMACRGLDSSKRKRKRKSRPGDRPLFDDFDDLDLDLGEEDDDEGDDDDVGGIMSGLMESDDDEGEDFGPDFPEPPHVPESWSSSSSSSSGDMNFVSQIGPVRIERVTTFCDQFVQLHREKSFTRRHQAVSFLSLLRQQKILRF